MRRSVSGGGRLLAWLLVGGAVAIIVTAVLIPRIAGATPYAVLTSSMEPDLPPGTLVVVKPADPDSIGIGSVITYQLRSGEPTVVTHRVVAQTVDADGLPLFRTQGDANDIPDDAWVRPVQIKGELWYSVPVLGRANTWLNGDQRQGLVYGVAALLLVYALFTWSSALRHRNGHRKEDGHEAITPQAPTPA